MDSIKAPEFWPNDPELWFITLESQFLLDKPSPITNDDTKFSYLISLLPPSTAIEKAIIKCTADSEFKKLQQLLTQEELGDRLPSQLLRHLRQLIGESKAVSDTTLKMLWMQRLPRNIQIILTTQEQASLNSLADLADRVTEITSSPSSSTSTLEKELASLRAEISALKIDLNKKEERIPRSRSRSSSSSRKSSPNSYRKYNPNGSWCWYHFRFKHHARKCISPCTFNKKAKNQHENSNNNHFLLDTGAEISVLPPRPEDRRRGPTKFTLTAANNSPINTYGERFLNRDLGLRRDFKWRFIIADTNKAILGADFMEHFGIIPDIKRKFIIDSLTKLRKRASITNFNSLSPKCSINSYEDKFLNILSHYPSLTKPPSYSTPVKHLVTHHITTKGQPTFSKPRRLNPEKFKIAKSEFEHMMELGLCKRGDGAWASPLHLQNRSREGVPPYPINQEDIPKTAITTPFGLFEFTRMNFGLKGASQTFQRFMDEVTKGLDFVFVYIDDVLIASKNENDHIQHLHTIFKRLSDHGLTVNISKSVFGKPSLEFLGHIIDNKGIKPFPEKIRIVKDFPQPNSTRQLQRFIGLVNFYHRYSKWPEAFPISDKTAISVAKAFFRGWISKYGVPATITTDQGREFESHLFKDLTSLIGTNRIRTTAYNPAANGLVERLHRQIKAAIMASGNTINWIDALPLVLLGIRTSYKEDLKCTAAEMVFGTTLNLPADLLTNSEFKNPDPSNFATQLKMVSRSSKTFTVKINDQNKVISVNRLKPAFIENTPQSFHDSSILPPMPDGAEETTPKTSSYTTRYGRHASQQNRIHQMDDQGETEELIQKITCMRTPHDYRINTTTSDPPYTIRLKVEENLIDFELDTGSCLTLISENDFEKYLPNAQLKTIGLIVKTYDDTVVPILGEVIVKIPSEIAIAKFLKEHQVLFNDTTEPIKGFTFSMNIRDVSPIFDKARPVPFAIRTAVTEALENMVTNGYLYRGKYFSKLDLSSAYLQLEVATITQPFLTINTHKGLFRFRRMPFGLADAPCYFQSVMDRVLVGIEGVICYIDDVLIATVSVEKHLAVLNTVEIEYMGHLIKEDGIRPLDHKVQALQKAKIESGEISRLDNIYALSYMEDLPITAEEIRIETQKDEVLYTAWLA
ncbi:hypothetical protein LAZ67_12002194 [Cordylochernes scorpioides]|uniref:Integrase catalytic domain-containing protein n=1 Tax=Cordylochernes scorpioides TaxID=51811 RepID=A0ABY6L1M5_9ARAC|nr:hypothetical protein LAZ67_12002194 [Cordylochernes scorpioides]